MFCHAGLGKAYRRSYEFFLSDVITSRGAKKKFYNVFKVEGFLGYPVKVIVKKFNNYVIHMYRYGGRQYYVFPENFYELFLTIAKLIHVLYKVFRRDVNRVFNYIDELINMCNDVDQCLDLLFREVAKAEAVMVRRVLRGRKALTTRFKKGIERCRDVVEKFFLGLRNLSIYMYKDSEDLENFLKSFLSDRVARAYQRFAELRNPILLARDSIIFLVKRDEAQDGFSIYVDDCSLTNSYAILKLVGVDMFNDYVYKIKWVAILGIDRLTNQMFLHYVPPTLILRKAEVCRIWLLNLVDNFGKPIYNEFKLVEV